jgi:hypothetical protein
METRALEPIIRIGRKRSLWPPDSSGCRVSYLEQHPTGLRYTAFCEVYRSVAVDGGDRDASDASSRREDVRRLLGQEAALFRPELSGGQSGAFTVAQRTSSDLKCNPHYHSVFLDGVSTSAASSMLR